MISAGVDVDIARRQTLDAAITFAGSDLSAAELTAMNSGSAESSASRPRRRIVLRRYFTKLAAINGMATGGDVRSSSCGA